MGVGLFVSVWVARYLGPENFGLYNYVVAFVSLFLPLSTLGIGSIIIRELVKDSSIKNEILGTAFSLQLICGIISAGLAVATTLIVSPGNTYINFLVAIVSITFLTQPLTVIDYWFQSRVESKYVVLSKNVAFFTTTGLKIILLLNQTSLTILTCLIVVEALIYSISLVVYYYRINQNVRAWRTKLVRIKYLLKESWPLLLTGIAVNLYLKIDQVMLGQIIGSRDVGIYAVAANLSEVWYIIPAVVSSSVYPAVIKSKNLDKDIYRKRLQGFYDLMALLSYCTVVIVLITAKPFILLTYGADYKSAVPILYIYVWTCVFAFQGIAQSTWIVSEGLQKINFYSTFSGAILNILLNLLLIPHFHGLGAAIATLISYAVASYFCFLVLPQTRDNALLMTKALFLPFRLKDYLTRQKNL